MRVIISKGRGERWHVINDQSALGNAICGFRPSRSSRWVDRAEVPPEVQKCDQCQRFSEPKVPVVVCCEGELLGIEGTHSVGCGGKAQARGLN